jgi:anti-sigma factor RsiW
MACPEYEDRIMEMQEGTLPVADRRAVEDHMAACEACGRFAQRLRELDVAMTATHSAPGLSADFKARLLQRIDLEAPGLSIEAIEARKQEMESEFATIMASLPRRVWRANLPVLLDVLGSVSVAILVVLVLRSALGRMPSLEAVGGLLVRCTTGYLAWIWAIVGVATGLLLAFGRRFVPWP